MMTPRHVANRQLLKPQTERNVPSLLSQICSSSVKTRTCRRERGTVLFAEGDVAQRVYILRSGSAAVSVSSTEGRVVILRMAHPGEVLGLNAVLANSVYDTTVKTLESCCVHSIARAELIAFIESNPVGAHTLVTLLSRELTQLTERTRSLLLPQTASGRLANLLLECGQESTRIDKVFTHDEIAQMIGSSRETVTRLFTMLKTRNIIQITSDSVVIRDRGALENMIESKSSNLKPCRASCEADSKAILLRKSLLRDSREITKAAF